MERGIWCKIVVISQLNFFSVRGCRGGGILHCHGVVGICKNVISAECCRVFGCFFFFGVFLRGTRRQLECQKTMIHSGNFVVPEVTENVPEI
jgi:hypothetical protein